MLCKDIKIDIVIMRLQHHDVFLSCRPQPTDGGERWHDDSVGGLAMSTHTTRFYFLYHVFARKNLKQIELMSLTHHCSRLQQERRLSAQDLTTSVMESSLGLCLRTLKMLILKNRQNLSEKSIDNTSHAIYKTAGDKKERSRSGAGNGSVFNIMTRGSMGQILWLAQERHG